jgi:predicted ester cyclase
MRRTVSVEDNKALIRRIPEEVYNEGNLAVSDEVIAADYVEHFPLPPGWPSGLEGLKQFISVLRAAFPDFRYTVEDEIAEGEKLVERWANLDQLGMMQQLGVIPPPGQSEEASPT